MESLIFDFDGVIVMAREKMVEAYTHAFKVVCQKEVNPQRIASALAPRVSQVPIVLGEKSPLAEKVADFAFDWYNEHTDESQLVPGILKFIERASVEHKIAIVTMNNRPHLERVVSEFGLNIPVIVTIDDVHEPRPSPEGLNLAMTALGALPEHTTVFGDTAKDMLAAKNAGCTAVGVLTGIANEKDLRDAGADIILESATEFKLND